MPFKRLLPILFALAGITLLFTGGKAQQTHRAGLVVRFGDGTVITRCVEFTEDSITGEEVLKRSGLSVIFDYSFGLGAAVCKIEHEGCDYPQVPCFCQCMGGGECIYWLYFHLKGGTWEYSGTGCSNYEVHDGDVEGWAWGPGSTTGGTQPPVIPFEQICPSSQPSPTPAPPTSTPTPTATATPVPATSTPTPTSTPTTELPTPTPTHTPVPTPYVRFWADSSLLHLGECTVLHWEVENVQAVYLNDEGVVGRGEREVCPSATTTYALRVVTATGEQTYPLTIQVIAPTPTPTSTPVTPEAISPLPSPTPAFTPTPLPTSTPLPKSTPRPTLEAAGSASPGPVPSPTATATPAITVKPTSTSALEPLKTSRPFTPWPETKPGGRKAPPRPSPAGYIAFGLVALGLIGLGVWMLLQGRS